MKSMVCYNFPGFKHFSKLKITVFSVKPWVFETPYAYFMSVYMWNILPSLSVHISCSPCPFCTPRCSSCYPLYIPVQHFFPFTLIHLSLYDPVILCTHLPFLEPIYQPMLEHTLVSPLTVFFLNKIKKIYFSFSVKAYYFS